jgi:tRNA G46 methylase TrmB
VSILESIHAPEYYVNLCTATQVPLDGVTGPVACFCALGNPETFENTLAGLGLELRQKWRFPDHQYYTREHLQSFEDMRGELPLITTFKDFVKFPDNWRDILKKDVYVLDPFCGSATLLIERAKKAPIRKAVGLDTYHDAIVEGTKSVEIAGVDAELLRKNYFEYTDKEVFDEIITEFPDLFQKDKQHRIEFIKSFINTSLSVSKRGSVWMILTNEKGLMKQQIRGTRSIYLMEEIPFGGYRSLYIIKKK